MPGVVCFVLHLHTNTAGCSTLGMYSLCTACTELSCSLTSELRSIQKSQTALQSPSIPEKKGRNAHVSWFEHITY